MIKEYKIKDILNAVDSIQKIKKKRINQLLKEMILTKKMIFYLLTNQ